MPTVFKTPQNNVSTTVASTHTIGATTLAVATGTGVKFGSPSAGAPIRITVIQAAGISGGLLTDPTKLTVFSCTGRTTDTLTGLTVIEGTSDVGFAAADTVVMGITAAALADIHTAVNNIENGTTTLAGTQISGNIAGNAAGLTANIAESQVTNLVTDLAGKSAVFVPTGVKTSSYTAVVNDLIPIDTTGGAVTITLPTAPADKSGILVKAIARTAPNNVTISAGGSDVFNKAGGVTSLTLSTLFQGVQLQYSAGPAIWYVRNDSLALSQIPAFVASGASHAAGQVPDPGATAGSIHTLREDAKWALIRSTGIGQAPDALGMTAWWHPAGVTTINANGTISGTIADLSGNGNTASSLGTGNLKLASRGHKCPRPSFRTNQSDTSLTYFGNASLSINEASFWIGGVMSAERANGANGQEVFCKIGTRLIFIQNGTLVFQNHAGTNFNGGNSGAFVHNIDGPVVWNVWGDGTNYYCRVNGVQVQAAIGGGGTQTVTGLLIGAVYGGGGTNTGFTGDFHDNWYRNTPPSAAELTSIEMYAHAEYSIPISADPAIPLIVFDGDSRTYGTGTTYKTRSWVELVMDRLGLRGAVQYYNFGEPGLTSSTLNTRAPALVDILYSATRRQNILVAAGGINDFTTFPNATNYIAYCTARQSAGWSVVACTLPNANGKVNVSVFNAAVRSGFTAYAVALADPGGDFRIGETVAVASGASTYFADGLHYNDLGHTVVEPYVSNALSQALSPRPKDPVSFAGTSVGTTAITLWQATLAANTVYFLRVFGAAMREDTGTESYVFSRTFAVVTGASTITAPSEIVALKGQAYVTLSTADISFTSSGLALSLVATGETGKTLFWRVGWELVGTI